MGEFFPAQVFKQLSHARAVIERHLAATLDTIHLFGSAIDGGLKPDSDIDLLVTVSAAPNDSLRQALARAQAARRVVGADLSAACAERENDCVLVLSCRKGCFLRTVPAGENPALWLLDIIRRTAANKPQAEGTGFLPARRAAKKDALPGPQPGRHPLRRVCMTLLVLALLAALAAVGAWEYTNGNFYALPEQLHTLLTEHVPRPGATLV